MNKLTKYACILTTLAGAVACSGGKKAQGDYAIIPLPQEVVTQGSAPFLLKPSTPISYQEGDAEMEQTARFLASYVKVRACLTGGHSFNFTLTKVFWLALIS